MKTAFSLFLAMTLSLIAQAASESQPPQSPVSIDFKAPELYPEGIAYDPTSQRFLVSSMREGKITAVDYQGKTRVFSTDKNLISSVGLLADPARNRLLACVSDPGVSKRTHRKTTNKTARVVSFDLKTGKTLRVVDLSKIVENQHFCNDLTLDAEGNVYATDSFTPVIYKIDANYQPSVFVKAGDFNSDGFNFNGIVAHPDGYLLVAQYTVGQLIKISLKDPSQRSLIKLEGKIPGADGLVLQSPTELVVVQNNGVNVVLKLTSTDAWSTAKVSAVSHATPDFPTTGVKTDRGLFVLNAKLGELFKDPKTAKAQVYSIREITF